MTDSRFMMGLSHRVSRRMLAGVSVLAIAAGSSSALADEAEERADVAVEEAALTDAVQPVQQSAAEDQAVQQEEGRGTLEEIVVTGTSVAKRSVSAPFSVTKLDGGEIARFNTNSLADIVRRTPGVTAEGGGGGVNINLFIRGLPQGGQIQLTPLQFDGLASVSTFGLSQINSDIFIQAGLGIAEMEFVRGGVSNLFGTGSVAGLLNFRSKKGSEEFEGILKGEWGDEGRFRTDFYLGGPIGDPDEGWRFATSGFFRDDDGPIDTGLDSQGVQLRGNITKEFEDQSGFVTFFGQFIDDSTQFFLPLPLDAESRKRVAGNDGRKIFSMNSGGFEDVSFQTPDGLFTTGIDDGTDVNGVTFGASFEKEFEDGWSIDGRTKYSDYDHNLAIFLNGDGLVNAPESQAAFLERRGLPGLQNAAFTFSETGEELPEDFLLFGNRILDLPRSFEDFTAELNLRKFVSTGNVDHQFTLGGFFARLDGDDDLRSVRVLGDFNRQSRAVDLTITDPDTGEEIIYSRDGLVNAGLGFQNRDAVAKRFAGYFADQIDVGRLSIEAGVRVEKFIGDVTQENTQTFDLNDFGRNQDLNLAPGLGQIVWGDGTFVSDEVSDEAWAASGAFTYDLSDLLDRGTLTAYGNFSRGFFMPQLRSQRFGPQGEFGTFEAEVIKTAEGGFKYSGPVFSGTIAGWWTNLKDRADVRRVNDPETGGTIEFIDLISTRAYGLEATWEVTFAGMSDSPILEYLTLDGNVTLQDHKFTKATAVAGQEGKELRRQPNVLIHNGLWYDDGRFDLGIDHSFSGEQFSNNVNTVTLDGFHLVNLNAGYRVPLEDSSVRFGFKVFNLTGSDGLTEGNPRSLTGQAQGDFFIGRPILPRRFFATVTYEF